MDPLAGGALDMDFSNRFFRVIVQFIVQRKSHKQVARHELFLFTSLLLSMEKDIHLL